MRNVCHAIIALVVLLTVTSCYRGRTNVLPVTANPEDSSLFTLHSSLNNDRHYSIGYNFLVNKDSIMVMVQQPEVIVSRIETDSLSITAGEQIAVTDIQVIPADSVDSVWVQVVSETGRLGWIHEQELLSNVSPTDPISRAIKFFSDTHVIVAIILVVVMAVLYIMRLNSKRNVPIVHFRDIDSFYPSLLCIIVATSATFYASLQMFGADTWQHYYYHPSMNPFSMPPILALFIMSVWAILLVGIATVDEVRRKLPLDEAILYILSLLAVCSILYIVFSISTLSYIGYPLLAAYCYYAVRKYFYSS